MNAVATLKAEIGHILDLITHVEDMNEWIHSFMHDQVDAADRFMATFIELAWNDWAYEPFSSTQPAVIGATILRCSGVP